MQELYIKLKNYTIKDAIKIEESDRQFIALKDLYNNLDLESKKYYLALIIANSIICYQLSGKWENYWEELSFYFSTNWIWIDVISKLWDFIKQSKNNKRFVETKIKRLEKLRFFLEEFLLKEKHFYENMIELRDSLAKTMNQKVDAKTIVFAIKMFSYWARNVFGFREIPAEICVPIDSRLTALFEKYKWDYSDIGKFYFDLSKILNIPESHLDAILWVNYNELMK